MTLAFLALAVIFLAFANGANDNFKGVATLYGSNRVSYRVALAWASVTTLAGSATALVVGSHLLATFSGKGIVPDEVAGDATMMLSVAFGAAGVVLLATRLGMPISTTHALLGGLMGGGLVMAGGAVRFDALGRVALLPLLVSPLAALALTLVLYRIFKSTRLLLRIDKESHVDVEMADPLIAGGAASASSTRLAGRLFGVHAQTVLDVLHFLSSGAVGFARGLNDTPKIVALLGVGAAIGVEGGGVLVAFAMLLGGLLAARRVAQTMSKEITVMNDGQGFSANLVTAGLVLVASRFGMPVSTTHVSVGSLFGIGAASHGARKRAVLGILTAWLITLPLAAALAALAALAIG